MNAFAPIGLGSAVSRGGRNRSEVARVLVAHEMVERIRSDRRGWLLEPGTHPADASALETITRLRTRNTAPLPGR